MQIIAFLLGSVRVRMIVRTLLTGTSQAVAEPCNLQEPKEPKASELLSFRNRRETCIHPLFRMMRVMFLCNPNSHLFVALQLTDGI